MGCVKTRATCGHAGTRARRGAAEPTPCTAPAFCPIASDRSCSHQRRAPSRAGCRSEREASGRLPRASVRHGDFRYSGRKSNSCSRQRHRLDPRRARGERSDKSMQTRRSTPARRIHGQRKTADGCHGQIGVFKRNPTPGQHENRSQPSRTTTRDRHIGGEVGSNIPSGDAACVMTLANGTALNTMFCHAELNTCVQRCTSDTDCPPAWRCDDRPDSITNAGNKGAFCVNPTCGFDATQ